MEWKGLVGDASPWQQAPVTGKSTGEDRTNLGNILLRVQKENICYSVMLVVTASLGWLEKGTLLPSTSGLT